MYSIIIRMTTKNAIAVYSVSGSLIRDIKKTCSLPMNFIISGETIKTIANKTIPKIAFLQPKIILGFVL